jgi:hypothetical protein
MSRDLLPQAPHLLISRELGHLRHLEAIHFQLLRALSLLLVEPLALVEFDFDLRLHLYGFIKT